MHWGLWTDEAGTFWMACEGWRAAISRSGNWPGQSILYGMIESVFVAKGFWLEPLLRMPSVLAMLFAAWQLKRLAELLISSEAGWLALVPFACAPEVVQFGTSARPYALATVASLASFRYLLEWQKSGRPDVERKTTAKYLAASVLTLYFHYLFGFIFLIQAAYLLCCILRGRKIRLSLPIAAIILLPVSMLPLIRQLLTTAQQAQNFAHATPPTVWQLLQACFPPILLVAIALGFFLRVISGRKLEWRPKAVRPELIFLIVTWMTLGPVIFFLAARITGQSIFATRYLLFAFPAFILLLTWIISGLAQQESRILVLLAIFAATVLHPANLWESFRPSVKSWREPLSFIATASRTATKDDIPVVLVASGIVDSGAQEWQKHDPSTSYLFAALRAYPLPNQTIPLPYQFSQPVKDFIANRNFGAYKPGQSCILLAASDSPLGDWMAGYMRHLGFEVETHLMNDFVVLQFRRQ